MFVIAEKMISLASFDVRLAHARTSVVFSYLIFSNFKFCKRKFKGLIALKKAQGFLKFCTLFECKIYKFLYQSHQNYFLSFLQKSILNSKLYSKWQI